MPALHATDDTLPGLARTFPLAAALLSSWEHEGRLLGELSNADTQRMDTIRGTYCNAPSIHL